MTDPSELSRIAAKKALKIRVEGGYPLTRPCDVYELIVRHKLELQFVSVPTLEGMYLEDGDRRRICVSAYRPPGRQHFTAAHECGHSFLYHGTKLDRIKDLRDTASEREIDEQLADIFATCLMMPNNTVQSGFRLRGIDPNNPTPADVYKVATWLRVGYTTLSNHMFYSMELMSRQHLRCLLRHEPKAIKNELAQQQTTKEVFQLDGLWDRECVQAQVGDFFTGITGSPDCVLVKVRDGLFTAARPGKVTVALNSGGVAEIKIGRENYVGLYEYRCLPEEE
jgi:Zn-dependent peptidase ImmA (M78 family)